jgi:DNA-binding GntR family transcriptional regulator
MPPFVDAVVVHPSRATDVYTQLKRDIAEFRLVSDDRFIETEISVRLAVSRTPVRQTLFKLQQEGQPDHALPWCCHS